MQLPRSVYFTIDKKEKEKRKKKKRKKRKEEDIFLIRQAVNSITHKSHGIKM